MNENVKHLYEWCHTERIEARRALELYERGTMRFRVNHVDVTEGQKASLRRIIDDMTQLIRRIEEDETGHIAE